jgi:hypothetical protein
MMNFPLDEGTSFMRQSGHANDGPQTMSDGRKILARWKKQAERAGWTVTMTGGGHLKWRSSSGQVVISPATPSDRRSVLNTRRDLRNAGLDVET